MKTDIEIEEDVGAEIDYSKVHTVYAVKDGMFEEVDKTELDKKNYFYRVHSKIPGIAVIDYDKTNVVPIVKDILNRQNTFIEIVLIRWVIVLNIASLLGLIILGIVVHFLVPNFDTQKLEIISEIRKVTIQNSTGQPQVAPGNTTIMTPTSTSTQSTTSGGYNPVLPSEVTPNTKKNVPNYAN